jgi:hypothetical protein
MSEYTTQYAQRCKDISLHALFTSMETLEVGAIERVNRAFVAVQLSCGAQQLSLASRVC